MIKKLPLILALAYLLAGCGYSGSEKGDGTERHPEFRYGCTANGLCVLWKRVDGEYIFCRDKIPPSMEPEDVKCESQKAN